MPDIIMVCGNFSLLAPLLKPHVSDFPDRSNRNPLVLAYVWCCDSMLLCSLHELCTSDIFLWRAGFFFDFRHMDDRWFLSELRAYGNS